MARYRGGARSIPVPIAIIYGETLQERAAASSQAIASGADRLVVHRLISRVERRLMGGARVPPLTAEDQVEMDRWRFIDANGNEVQL